MVKMIKPVVTGLFAIFAVAAAQFNNNGNGGRRGNRPDINGNLGYRRGIGDYVHGNNQNGQVGDLTFLKNVTDPAVRAKFQSIYFNHTLNETSRADAVFELVKTLDSNVQAAYANWKAAKELKNDEWEVVLSEKIANLSALTDTLQEEANAIKNNASMTNEEKILNLPSKFEKMMKSVGEIMNGLYYVDGAPKPEDGAPKPEDSYEYPNYPESGNWPDFPGGNYPDYPYPGGPIGGPGPCWPFGPGPGGPGGPGNRPRPPGGGGRGIQPGPKGGIIRPGEGGPIDGGPYGPYG